MFTDSELLHIIQTTQNLQLGPASTKIIPTKSGEGVVSRKLLEDKLQAVIDTSDDRVTFNELSKLLDVDDKYIAHALKQIVEDEWGVNGRQVVPKKPFAILENDLRGQLKDGVVTVIKYCREKDITTDFLKKLLEFLRVEWSTNVCWLGGERYVYSEAFFETVIDSVKEELEESIGPVEFDQLSSIKSGEYPLEFAQRVLVQVSTDEDLDGFWAGGNYIPNSYKSKRQEEALEQLKLHGFIAHKQLKRAYVDKLDAFLAKNSPGCTTLPSHYVTQEWLDRLEKEATRSLDGLGFASITELAYKLKEDDQLQLQTAFRKKQSRKLLDHGGNLVTTELVDELTRIGLAYATKEAEKAWTTAVSTRKAIYPTTIAWRDLLHAISLDHGEVPTSSLESIGKLVLTKATARYLEKVNELRETASASAKLHFVDKLYLRFLINVTAVLRVKDTGLQEKLAQDLVAYYHRIILDSLTKLLDRVSDNQSQRKNACVEDAINSIYRVNSPEEPIKALDTLQAIHGELKGLVKAIDMEEPTAAVLEAKKREMQQELRTQLDKTVDVSVMMLIVLILHFSEKEDGILRATGKYAPKILKQLKARLAESEYEFLNSVKTAVIARSELSSEDVERLRQMA